MMPRSSPTARREMASRRWLSERHQPSVPDSPRAFGNLNEAEKGMSPPCGQLIKTSVTSTCAARWCCRRRGALHYVADASSISTD